MVGYGHKPHMFVAGFDDESHDDIHRRFATLLDEVLDEIAEIKRSAHAGNEQRPQWPMIVFRTPKGWTGPDYIDGKKTTGSWRAHQVPLASARDTPEHLDVLRAVARVATGVERAVRRGRPAARRHPRARADGRPADERQPARQRRAAAQGPAPAGLPRLRGRRARRPAARSSEAPRVLGDWLTDVIRLNPDNFRIFGPDETASNRLQAVFETTDKQWNAEFFGPDVDEHLARAGPRAWRCSASTSARAGSRATC